MNIIHQGWGIIIKLPNGAEIEIHNNYAGKLSELTLNGIGGKVSCDITFKDDGDIYADGFNL